MSGVCFKFAALAVLLRLLRNIEAYPVSDALAAHTWLKTSSYLPYYGLPLLPANVLLLLLLLLIMKTLKTFIHRNKR